MLGLQGSERQIRSTSLRLAKAGTGVGIEALWLVRMPLHKEGLPPWRVTFQLISVHRKFYKSLIYQEISLTRRRRLAMIVGPKAIAVERRRDSP
jgi:hypothetical protein